MKRLSIFVLFAMFTMIALAPGARAQDDSTILPAGAVNATEILNETGVAQNLHNSFRIFLPTSDATVVLTSTITVPTSGYVLAIGSGTVGGDSDANDVLDAIVGVSTDCGETPNMSSAETQSTRVIVALFEDAVNDWIAEVPFSVQKIYPVAVEDTPHVFCILARAFQPDGDRFVNRIMLSLLFIPTAYGEVEQ